MEQIITSPVCNAYFTDGNNQDRKPPHGDSTESDGLVNTCTFRNQIISIKEDPEIGFMVMLLLAEGTSYPTVLKPL